MGLKFKETSNLLLLLSIINDTFFAFTFGREVLLLVYLFFLVCNYKIIFFGKKLKKAYLVNLLFFSILLSLVFNSHRYDEISFFNAINLIFINFCVFKFYSFTNVNNTFKYLIISVLISILLQFFYNEPLSEYTFRVSGGTGDPNEFSAQVLYSLVIFPLILFDKLRMSRFKILYFLYYAIATLAILKAGSTTAGIILAIITIFNIYRFLKNNIKYSLIFLTTAFFAFFFLFNYLTDLQIVSDYLDRSSSNEGGLNSRVGIWKVSELIISENVFFGVGPTNFPIYSEIYSNYSLTEGSKAAHNIFILLFAESGIISILLLLIIILQFFIETFRERLNFRYLFSIMVIFMMGLSLSMFYEKYFWVFMGIMINVITFKRDNNKTIVKL